VVIPNGQRPKAPLTYMRGSVGSVRY